MSSRIYLDNAATTPLDKDVLEVMLPFFTEKFGNPSSIYSFGRETKMAVEHARKSVAHILNTKPANIFFTSGGTESSNVAINSAVNQLGCTRIISSKIEHHATLHTVENLKLQNKANLEFVNLLTEGVVDYEDLEHKLATSKEKTLVTLMHANNEIGNLLDAKLVGNLCEKYNAIFHCDAVQTIAHYPLDVKELKVHFISGAGHKFHGPKGVGILYIQEAVQIKPMLLGGAQERNMRAGTENVYGIVGFAKALEIATENYHQDSAYILDIKNYFKSQLLIHFPNAILNGDQENSLYTVLNICLPANARSEMLIMNLDINGICVSGGSACSSGVESISHVIYAIRGSVNLVPVRFSFSKYNTKAEIDIVINIMKDLV